MKILLIAQEPALSPASVVTGNAIRTHQLTTSLEKAGHEVVHAWRDHHRTDALLTFRDRDDLRGLLMRQQADLHLVCYWELLDLMPFETEVPLVLDFLAPRPLETVFENPASLRHDLRRLQVDLSKVDLLMTGNELQKNMMLLPLLEAGLDLSTEAGAVVIPLGADGAGQPRSNPLKDGWKLVSGGVNWPWRDSARYWKAIDEHLDLIEPGNAELVLFGGDYTLHGEGANKAAHTQQMNPLMPYREFSAWLLDHAHIGLELAEENVERRLSQSFRSIEFLRHGLPLICNSWLPIAADIRQWEAGWLVEQPEDIPGLLRDVFADEHQWRQRSENALRLAEAKYSVEETGRPLIEWVADAHKAKRLPRQIPAPAELRTPPWRERLGRMVELRKGFYHPRLPEEQAAHPGTPQLGRGIRWLGRRIRWLAQACSAFLKAPVYSLQRLIFRPREHQGIILITRGDLFPADHGAAVKIVETARGLSFQGVPVAIVTDHRKYWWEVSEGKLERRRVPWWIRLLSPPEKATKAMHYSKDIPLNNAFLYLPVSDRSFFYRTLHVGRKIGAGTLQAEFPAYVQPGVHARGILDARLVLVQHNVEYERLRSQVKELTQEQYQRYKSIEIDLCNQCDVVICVSDNDRQKLAEDGVDLDRLYTVPHGVDLEQFELPPEPTARERFGIPESAPLLVYHGTFSYPPNLQALRVYARELLPRLEQLGHECHVLAVGREPPAKSPHPRIHLTGSVDKVGPWLKAADLAVVPLLDGGGTRMKIIDCFAAGTPVVSTSKGIEGIPVINGQQALVIDDWDDMAESIARLISNPPAAEALAKSAREMADAMDWKSIAAEYVRIFESLDSQKTG